MDLADALLWILRVLAGVVLLRLLFPHLLLLVGVRKYRNGTYGGPEDLAPTEPDGDDERASEVYREKYRTLRALGFRPLGVHWSTIGKTISTESYLFGAPEHACLAQIFARSLNLYLVTACRDGAALEVTEVEITDIETPDFVVVHVTGESVEEMLALHRQHLERFRAAGHEPRPVASLEDSLAIMQAVNTHPANQRRIPSAALSNLGCMTLLVAVPAGIAALIFGFNGAAPWLGIIVPGLLLHWMWESSSTRVKLGREKDGD